MQRSRQSVSLAIPPLPISNLGNTLSDKLFDLPGTVAYLAERGVRITEDALRGYRRYNKGPRSVKIAGRIYWSATDLERWLLTESIASERGGVK